jgi:hypothetical protein
MKTSEKWTFHTHTTQGILYFCMIRVLPSISRQGNFYDNAMSESIFSILKTKYIYRHKLKFFDETRLLIVKHIDLSNFRAHTKKYARRHSKNGVWLRNLIIFYDKAFYSLSINAEAVHCDRQAFNSLEPPFSQSSSFYDFPDFENFLKLKYLCPKKLINVVTNSVGIPAIILFMPKRSTRSLSRPMLTRSCTT